MTKKSIISFLGENEKSDKIEELLKNPLIIGEPENIRTVEKSPEERKYLVLYYASDEAGGEDIKSFEFITGRIATYKFIRNIIESLDIHESKVISESATLGEMISVYEFMKHVSSLIESTDSFDIEDYNHGDYSDEV